MTRTLILGGTAWLGREIAAQALARGAAVTCLARGSSGSVAAGATLVPVDRRDPRAYEAVADVEWDEIVELSYDGELVAGALAALADTARHWTLISSVSVYASTAEPGADEDAALVEPTDPADYAHAKVAAERVTAASVGDRLLIARPGLIAGPGDTSDRFGYWPSRLALAGDAPVLVPDTADRVAQFIDVRDLASWVADAAAQARTGIVDVVGEQRPLAAVLAAAVRIAGHTGRLEAADDEWLLEHDVRYWAGPRSLPLWLPRSDTAFAQRAGRRFVESGGTTRSLDETLLDVVRDERARGLSRERRAGLTRPEELLLLDALRRR